MLFALPVSIPCERQKERAAPQRVHDREERHQNQEYILRCFLHDLCCSFLLLGFVPMHSDSSACEGRSQMIETEACLRPSIMAC